MIVHHGSSAEILTVDFDKCRIGTDFGKGFYVTKIKEQAEVWANKKSKNGVITSYNFEISGIAKQMCNIKQFIDYNEEWFDFVVMNRQNKTDVLPHNYDIVEGPIADDDVGREIDRYIVGEISKNIFFEKIKFRKVTHQISFHTEKSLQLLEKITDNKIYLRISDIGKQIINKLIKENEFAEKNAFDIFYRSDAFSKLSDVKTKLYEEPIEHIYNMLKEEIL